MPSSRLLLAVAAALLAVASGKAPECTDAERSARSEFVRTRPRKCQVQLDDFKVCDEDCLAVAQKYVTIAPNCSYHGISSYYEAAMKPLKDCESWRAGENTTFRYMPVNVTGMAKCDNEELDTWSNTYDRVGTVAFDCVSDNECSDECLKEVEESVLQAPVCPLGLQGYSYGEHKKKWLLRCLKARNESAASNAVVYSVHNVDGSFTSVKTPEGTTLPIPSLSAPKATVPPSSKAPTTAAPTQPAPAATQTNAPAPAATQTNSAAQPGLPVLTAVAASIAFYTAM